MPTSNITQYTPLSTISKKEIDKRFKDLHRFMGYLASLTGGGAYLVYTAFVSQTGTGVPTATVLENTLGGDVVWTRDSMGSYIGTLSGAFPAEKTFIPPFALYAGSATNLMPLGDMSDPIAGYYTMYSAEDGSDVVIDVCDASMIFADLGTIIGDTALFVEVRVYQQ